MANALLSLPNETIPTGLPMKLISEIDAARRNRNLLRAGDISSVTLIGCAGCGKTSLMAAASKGLACKNQIAMISADIFTEPDALRVGASCQQFLQIDAAPNSMLKASDVEKALGRLRLDKVKLLLIENVSGFTGRYDVDLGEEAKVCVFSVAAGEGQAAEFAGAIRCAKLVVLNKIDMLSLMPFSVQAFKNDVLQINPGATVLELSTSTGEGVAGWLNWLARLMGTKGKSF